MDAPPRPPEPLSALPPRRIGALTCVLLIIANMIGVGVFTTTGALLRDIGSANAVLVAWLVGGIAAVCGALAYAELGAAMPHNGGEYQLLSRIYHPALWFTAGWISLVVGFSAPLALMAIVFGTYLHLIVPSVPALLSGSVMLVLLSVLHAADVGLGSRFQNLFSLGKVLLISGFIVAGLLFCDPSRIAAASSGLPLWDAVGSGAFARGLIPIAFTYTGWNAAAYLAGEFKNPERTLPLSLVTGTVIVTALYLGLNFVFLASAPAAVLVRANEDIGHVAATHLFGNDAGRFVSFMIVLGLVSTMGALIMTGPRVYEAMGRDYPALRLLTVRSAGGGPVTATLLQAAVSLAMLLTASFGTLLDYIGFTLSLVALLTVLGVCVLRIREPSLPRPYRMWGYPATALAFVLLQVWMMAHSLIGTPQVALSGVGTLLSGLVLYAVLRPRPA